MDIKEFAEKRIQAEYDAFHKGDYSALERMDDPDVVYHLLAVGQETRGAEAHKQYIDGFRHAVPGMRIEWQYLTGDGNLFALQFKTSGSKFINPLPGLPPPTGKEITADLLFLFRVKDGRVAEAWSNGVITGLT